MTNAYPELPEQPYQRTSVAMSDVIAYLQAADFLVEVKRATYVVFRNESANGQSGVNNNYSGMQADGARWDASIDHFFIGTTTAIENGTGRSRIFLCFASWQDSVACLAGRLEARGLYVGGRTHLITQMDVTTAPLLATAYHREWVTGSATAMLTAAENESFLSMYTQAVALFRPPVVGPVPAPASVPAAQPDLVTATPPRPSFSVTLAENARLRAAIADAMATLQAALDGPSLADNSSDDLNAEQLARMN